MKERDWNGRRITVTAKVMNLKMGLGEEFRIRASWEDEALVETQRIVSAFHKDFQRKTGGDYQVSFSREI